MTQLKISDWRVPRLPYEPLAETVRADTTVGLSRIVGVHRDTARRWRERGLNIKQAEDAAHQLGCHPSAIWGHHYATVCAILDPEPEPEPGNRFGGKPLEYAAIGHARYYGLHGDFT